MNIIVLLLILACVGFILWNLEPYKPQRVFKEVNEYELAAANAPLKDDETLERERKQKQMNKELEAIMAYNVETAYQRKSEY